MTGTIVGFSGSRGSGLGALAIRDDEGRTVEVYCENAPTVRALDAAFGDGHEVNVRAILGKRIKYGLDDMGVLLAWIAPVNGDD